MAKRSNKEICLTSYENLLGIEDVLAGERDKVVDVLLSQLYPFKGHPFHVTDDDKMTETAESIRRYGVLNPGLVRVRTEGGYEIISGHRRKRGCELAGKKTMPVIIKDCTDDEAVIRMIDSNIQREQILPSEKAYAYKMKLEALKHQGVSTGQDMETAGLVGRQTGDSGRTVQRYIRLTQLHPDLLALVDCDKIKFIPAVALSSLSGPECCSAN